MKFIAIIPARGGSKGVPRKNIKLLAGKPLVAYSIEHALAARHLSRVIVSTEDDEIAGIAQQYGAEVIKRPAELAQDTTPTEPVLQHVVNILETEQLYTVDGVVLLQPTSPIRRSGAVDRAIERFLEVQADSVLSVCEETRFFWRVRDGRVDPLYDFKNRRRRQDIVEGTYRENGSIYVTRRETLMTGNNRLGGNIELFVMSQEESIEVDTQFDFRLAEQLLNKLTA